MPTIDINYVCRLTFNRLDFEVEHKGEKVKDYVYWKECNPDTVRGPSGPMVVGGGYLIIYPNKDTLHTYDHPENIFKKIN